MESYWRLVQFLKLSKRDVVLKILLMLSIMATYVLQAFAISRGVSAIFNNNGLVFISICIGIAVGSIILRAFLIRLNESFSKLMGAKIKGKIRDTLLEKLYLLGPGYQSGRRSGNLNSLLTDGIEAMEAFLVNYIPQMFIAFTVVVGLVIYMAILDWIVALIIFGAVAAAVIGPHLTMPFSRKSTVEYWKSYAILNAQYIDAMQGMNTLKVFHAGKRKGNELGQDAENFRISSTRNTGISLLSSAMITFLMTVGTSASIVVGALHANAGLLDATGLVTILFLISECFRPVTDLNNFWHASYLGFSVAEQYYSIIDEPVVLIQQGNTQSSLNDELPEIKFENVDFSYCKDNSYALKNLSIHAKAGETIAVVGQSGSGKSTMVNLLMRFYDVDKGKIVFDGHDVKEYDITELRKNIAVVFQDTYLFYGTIAENLRMCKPDATQEELENAAKAANCHGFISALPDGYNTIVGERGATLSGGERQRIAIARAVLKDAPFLILDEATSSVDAASEREIQQALDRLMENRTTMIIAHRLSTVKNADKIYVLENGFAVEEGSHDELIHKNGVYRRLVEAQAASGGEKL